MLLDLGAWDVSWAHHIWQGAQIGGSLQPDERKADYALKCEWWVIGLGMNFKHQGSPAIVE